MASTVRWEVQGTHHWKCYDEDNTRRLEKAYQRGDSNITFTVESRGGQRYTVIFSEGKQYNEDTSTARDVRRIHIREQPVSARAYINIKYTQICVLV